MPHAEHNRRVAQNARVILWDVPPALLECGVTAAAADRAADWAPVFELKGASGMEFGRVTTLMMHMYRAEVGKLAIYRTRLDTTTTWGLTVLAVFLSILLGRTDDMAPELPPLLVAILCYFCLIEARRYLTFLQSQRRVRLLEKGFYVEATGLGGARKGWLADVHRSLLENEGVNDEEGDWALRSEAFFDRFRKSYGAMCAFALLTWLAAIVENGDLERRTAHIIWFVCSTAMILVLQLLSYRCAPLPRETGHVSSAKDPR